MATNPTLLTQPIAANGAKNVIPNTTSTAGAMSQDQGFPAETALPLGAGGVAPTREDFNGAFNLLSGIAFMAQKGWQFEFDETQDYFAGCIVRDTLDGKLYEALNDVPASSTHPSTDSTNWKEFRTDTSNLANIDLSNLDTANLACHVVVDSYYDSTTGDWWREYDDGWVEQGGFQAQTTAGTAVITFLKPFAAANATVIATFNRNNTVAGGADNSCDIFCATRSITTTNAYMGYTANYTNAVTNIGGWRWIAFGMGASV